MESGEDRRAALSQSPAMAAPACLRWRVNVGAWPPDDAALEAALALLPPGDAAAARAPAARADRARAAVARLLVRAAVAAALGTGGGETAIERTVKGGKPFARAGASAGAAAAARAAPRRPPNFNFNASHDGPWVAVATHSTLLVGVDVAAPRGGGPRGAASLEAALGPSLAPPEWAAVWAEPTPAAQDALFRRFWACKEAWGKARGDGVAAGFGSAVFTRADSPSPRLTLAGAPAADWRFDLVDLGAGAALATAVGPPRAAVDAGGTFVATLGARDMAESNLRDALDAPLPPWDEVSVAELVRE